MKIIKNNQQENKKTLLIFAINHGKRSRAEVLQLLTIIFIQTEWCYLSYKYLGNISSQGLFAQIIVIFNSEMLLSISVRQICKLILLCRYNIIKGEKERERQIDRDVCVWAYTCMHVYAHTCVCDYLYGMDALSLGKLKTIFLQRTKIQSSIQEIIYRHNQ